MKFFGGKSKPAPNQTTSEESELLLHKDHDGHYDPENVQDPENQLIEILLPWGAEQKVAMWLNMIKIPMIILVALLGSLVEGKVGHAVDQAWTQEAWWPQGPSCYVNKMNMAKWFDNNSVDFLHEYINETAQYLQDYMNRTFQGENATCKRVNKTFSNDHWECPLFDSQAHGFHWQFNKTHCNIDFKDGKCNVGTEYEKMYHLKEDRLAGFGTRLPFLTYSLVWAFFKLTFLPVHPIDRVVNFFEEKQPPSQPIFKLLTEPFVNPKTCGGACSKIFNLAALVIKIVRYTLLPNSLIVPLLTMESHPDCPDYFSYIFDKPVGNFIYYWVIFEVVVVFALYAFGKTVYGSRYVGTKLYRCYKVVWWLTCGISIWLFIIDQLWTFNFRFWQGLEVVVRLIIRVSFDYRFSIDFVKLAASINVMLDIASLFVMIATFLCPKAMAALTGGGVESRLASTGLGAKIAPALGIQVPTQSTGSTEAGPTASTGSKAGPTTSSKKGGLGGFLAGFTGKK